MKSMICAAGLLLSTALANAQETNPVLAKGNQWYKSGSYEKANASYARAIEQSPHNPTAHFNQGNALYRGKKPEEAINAYERVVRMDADVPVRANAWYNRGVILSSQKKVDESIDAYRQALRLNPADSFARENLVRAMREKQQQQQQQKQQQKQQEKQQPKLNKKQVQQLLQALQEQEKQLQQKAQKSKVPSPHQPEKDW